MANDLERKNQLITKLNSNKNNVSAAILSKTIFNALILCVIINSGKGVIKQINRLKIFSLLSPSFLIYLYAIRNKKPPKRWSFMRKQKEYYLGTL